MPVKADYARAQWAYSELLSPTQRDKESRHAMLPVGSMRAGRVRRLGSKSHFVGQPQVESS